jgi:hypothetical protein
MFVKKCPLCDKEGGEFIVRDLMEVHLDCYVSWKQELLMNRMRWLKDEGEYE